MKSSELLEAAAVRLAITRAAGATCENEASGIRIYDSEPDEVLWDADTKCDHDIQSQPGVESSALNALDGSAFS